MKTTDAWFIGFTPECISWSLYWIQTNPTRHLGKKETGSRAALPMFKSFISDSIMKELKPDNFIGFF